MSRVIRTETSRRWLPVATCARRPDRRTRGCHRQRRQRRLAARRGRGRRDRPPRRAASFRRKATAWVRAHGPASPTHPALTGAGKLPCRAVIHAVGPVWGEGDEDRKLAAAVTSSLALAAAQGFAQPRHARHQHRYLRLPQSARRARHPAGRARLHRQRTPRSRLQKSASPSSMNPRWRVFRSEFDRRWPPT